MARGKGKWSGQGTRPGVAMLMCAVFVLLAGTGLWYADRLMAPAPVAAPAPPAPAAPPAEDQQAALVSDEDVRIEAAVFARPRPGGERGPATTVLRPRTRPYTLDGLIALGAAVRVNPTTVDIVRSVVVLPGASLDVEAPGTTLHLISTPAGFVSIVGWKGAITLGGGANAPLTITSWDPGAESPDTAVRDGRAYLRSIGAALTVRFAHVRALGFWSGRTGGIALTGLDDTPSTGAISDTEVDGNHYGLFTSNVNKLEVVVANFRHSELDGVLLHRGTANVVVERSSAEANGADGFVADRGSQAITLKQVTAAANAGDGIHFDGGPLSDDAGPSGASNASHKDFRLENSASRENRDDGVRALDTDQLVITGNQITGHEDGIVVTGRSPGAQIIGNTVTGAVSAAIAVRTGPSGVVVRGNHIDRAEIGLQVRDAQVDLRDNVVIGVTNHGLSVVGAAHGTTIEGNSLRGAGASPVDVARVSPPAVVTVGLNDTSGWKVEVSLREYVSDLVRDHPLLPLWALVLLAPLVLILVHRRRGTRPYVEGGGVPEPPATPLDDRGETLLIPRVALSPTGAKAASYPMNACPTGPDGDRQR